MYAYTNPPTSLPFLPNEINSQMEIRDLSKYGSSAVVRGQGVTFADTTSPVDPGDKGKVAEAVDVCFPEKVKKGGRQSPHPFVFGSDFKTSKKPPTLHKTGNSAVN